MSLALALATTAASLSGSGLFSKSDEPDIIPPALKVWDYGGKVWTPRQEAGRAFAGNQLANVPLPEKAFTVWSEFGTQRKFLTWTPAGRAAYETQVTAGWAQPDRPAGTEFASLPNWGATPTTPAAPPAGTGLWPVVIIVGVLYLATR